MRVNRPVRFDGTEEEALANMKTHEFMGDYDEPFPDWRCMKCDCKPWHVAAKYPCGVEPERETIDIEVKTANEDNDSAWLDSVRYEIQNMFEMIRQEKDE